MAIVNVAAIVLLSLRGFPKTAFGIAIGIGALSGLLELSYSVRREDERVFWFRRSLDRIVRLQWVSITIVGGVAAVICGSAGWRPFEHADDLAQAAILGLAIAAPVVYLSAEVDWWWILPKISGITGSTPCTAVGSKLFEGTTKVWYAHRSVATLLITVVAAGVPGYMAGQAKGGAGGTIWTIVGALVAVAYNAVNGSLVFSFSSIFNARFRVGQTIRVSSREHGFRDAYVVDVSIAGLKYLEEAGRTPDGRPCFANDGVPMGTELMKQTDPADNPRRFCRHHDQCRAINWYCFRNPNANHVFIKDDYVVPVKSDRSPLYPASKLAD